MKAGPPLDEIKKKPAPKKAAAPSKRNLEEDIGAVLVTVNVMAVPFIGSDALDDAEIIALAKAMNDQAQRSPRFRKYVEKMLSATGASSLIGIVLIIAGRRAARHGAISPMWDPQLEAMLRVQNMNIDPNDPAAMEAAAEMLTKTMTETPSAAATEPVPGAAAPAF